ncbi:MAG: leucine-rich repeat protein [Clostridia bacterium]|nr:leucine-rich repeat protein [Clostridia bacterium]
MVFKCKMCGGSLEIPAGATVVKCSYCDTQQTLPRLADERRANLYDRAGHFRRNNEFDKAAGIYENILAEDPADAEAYWSLVLCRFGIEYVEDPATKRRLPTVNRAQFTSIFDDENYKAAVAHADAACRALYETEAEAINKIQRGILEISQKEEPFDVFICYKETDGNGRRTHDSVLAQELYYQLKQEGFRVFFSRITLEDKLGSAYEPYIFAALQSSKAMVVLGTHPEHFNAVWVKNEWSRYLSLIKGGASKVLIPAYRDMDPYDLPEEFSHLQAQDMSKLGFMQDLVRGIKKIVGTVTPKAVPVATPAETVAAVNVSALLRRAALSLEDGDFEKADDFCEQVLNQDPENGRAYFYKLMAELEVESEDRLSEYTAAFEKSGNYQKALRFGDDKQKTLLTGYVQKAAQLRQQREDEALEWQLLQALRSINKTENSIYALDDANALLKRLQGLVHKPYAAALIPKCESKIAKLEELIKQEREIAEAKNQERKRLKRRLLIIAACGIAALILIVSLIAIIYNAVTHETVDGIEYLKEDDGYYVLKADVGGTLTIPDVIDGIPVVGIKESAFQGCIYLKKITIPKSVTEIGFATFNGCNNLESISFSLESIGEGSLFSSLFGHNVPQSLKTVIITGGTTVAHSFFSGCSSLTTIIIPESVTEIGNCAFKGCNSLESISLSLESFSGDMSSFSCLFGSSNSFVPTSLKTVIITGGTTVAYSFFSGCSSLTSVAIPESVTSIGGSAFSGCSSLTSVTIPNSVTSIGNGAFKGCSSLTSVAIPESVTSIGYHTFSGCSSLTSVTIPNSVTSIGDGAFSSCSSLTSIAIPESVTSIGNGAFKGCSSLTSVTIPNSVTSIGGSAFYNCNSLTSIIIPNSVTSIGNAAFSGCSLTTVYYDGNATKWNRISVDLGRASLTAAKRYYYSKTKPIQSGNYWHYDANGNPVIW